MDSANVFESNKTSSLMKITDLPPEIIRLVCAQFCDHCSRPWLDGDLVDKASLRNLSETCRFLGSIAQSFLFHRPWLGRNIYKCSREDDYYDFSLISALASHDNNLASSVREVVLGSAALERTPERMQFFQTLARDLQLGPAPGEAERIFHPECIRQRQFCYPQPFARFTHELIVAMLPNLTRLTYSMGYSSNCANVRDMVIFNSFLKRRFDSRRETPGLPNLQYLKLYIEKDDSKFSFADPGMHVLLNAAPNIMTLVLSGTDGISYYCMDRFPMLGVTMDEVLAVVPKLPHLRSLSFQESSIQDDSTGLNFAYIRRLIQNASHMERFQFQAGTQCGSTIFRMDRLITMLEPAVSTLKDVTFQYSQAHWEFVPILNQGNLAKLPGLDVLRLDQGAFCQHRPFPGETDLVQTFTKPRQNTCLTDTVALNIKFLILYLQSDCPTLGDILRLTNYLTLDKYPNLQHVQIDYYSETPTCAREVFESTYHSELDSFDHRDVARSFLETAKVKVWVRGTNYSIFDQWDSPLLARIGQRS